MYLWLFFLILAVKNCSWFCWSSHLVGFFLLGILGCQIAEASVILHGQSRLGRRKSAGFSATVINFQFGFTSSRTGWHEILLSFSLSCLVDLNNLLLQCLFVMVCNLVDLIVKELLIACLQFLSQNFHLLFICCLNNHEPLSPFRFNFVYSLSFQKLLFLIPKCS